MCQTEQKLTSVQSKSPATPRSAPGRDTALQLGTRRPPGWSWAELGHGPRSGSRDCARTIWQWPVI